MQNMPSITSVLASKEDDVSLKHGYVEQICDLDLTF